MRSIGKALRNMRRTPYQTMAAISVLSITFFVTFLIGFITLGLNQALLYFESSPQILVFFDTTASQEEILTLKSDLEQNSQVASVTYVAQDEALEIYQDLNRNDPLLLELVTADILPASLDVSAVSISALPAIKTQAENAVGVEEVVFRSDVVDTLNKWLTGIKYAGGGFIGIMIVTSILIIAVVVGMKIAGRQYEIKVMRLMGAGNWYIQAPYLIEGALYGLFASIFAFSVALSLVLYTSPLILEFAGDVPLIPETSVYTFGMLGVAVVSGMIIGMFGSYIAVKRFLRL